MALMQQQVVITANPAKPVQEISNIIAGFLRIWPGSEVEILTAVRGDIDKALEHFEKQKAENQKEQGVKQEDEGSAE
ncbi:MAG: hypothetical protein C6P35_03320 [Cohnella sp.]|uniref:hypothetical protein n=1 Tax=Cohnella sp. TaxID=1883426 RepID=UPI000E3861E3|nr:hypothetical protein [Cohnella sp.]REK68013.1 MAG: hypothetical protein C6P35_03320 [Cohnella sp.]